MVKVVDRKPGQSAPVASIEGETYYPKAVLYSSSSSSPTVTLGAGRHGGSCAIKVVADWQRGGMDQANRLYSSSSSSSPAIMCHGGGKRDVKVVAEAEDDLVVSILTPRECWRLMGFPEWAYLRASRVSSETQLYNQAGNSIVVEVLMAIFNSMFRPPRRRVQTTLEAVA